MAARGLARSEAGTAPGRGGRLALALLLAVGAINYVDRVTLSVTSPMISAELHLRPGETGVLLSSFLWAYAAAQAPAGVLADRVAARPLLGGALGLWSAAQAAAGLAASLPQLVGLRLALGLGEAPQWPVAARVIQGRFAPQRRGLAMGVVNSASTLGPAVAPPIVTALMLAFGWRGAFVGTGLAGGLAALAWLALYRDRSPQPAAPAANAVSPLRLFATPTLWAMVAGNFGAGYLNWFYAAWLPTYLESARRLSVAQTGWAAGAPFLFGFLGSLGGGWVCDKLREAGLAPIASRKAPIVAGLAGAALFTGLALAAPSATTAVAAICGALFFANAAGAAIWGLAIVAAPEGRVAQAGAVQNLGGLVGGAVAPIVTGLSVEATHGFAAAMAVAAAAALTGSLVYLLGVNRPIEEGLAKSARPEPGELEARLLDVAASGETGAAASGPVLDAGGTASVTGPTDAI
jgi:MFS family permease